MGYTNKEQSGKDILALSISWKVLHEMNKLFRVMVSLLPAYSQNRFQGYRLLLLCIISLIGGMMWDSPSFPTEPQRTFPVNKNEIICGNKANPQIPGICASNSRTPTLRGIVHLQELGDLTFQNGTFAGTRGESRRLEGFSLLIDDQTPDLGVRYMAHIQNTGDTPWVNDGKFIGTKGESLRLEGFAIQLTGKASGDYNIFYACHLQNLGDTQIRSNGDFCGTRGESRRLEGLQVWIEEKN